MIITLEGAPAVGKSTVANELATRHGYFQVAEVNQLFPTRPAPEPEAWYCQRQLDRCKMASAHEDSVLDGDPFQAVWFDWLYPDRGFSHWSNAMAFFIANAQSITLPSFYAYLHIDTCERYRREHSREQARGHTREQFLRKWDKYVDFQRPQQSLYTAMAEEYPGWVCSIVTEDLTKVVDELISTRPPPAPTSASFMAWLADWLSATKADDFR